MSHKESRLFTALKGGVPVRRGTFHDEKLLRMDLPESEYELVLDKHLDFPEQQADYSDHRRLAYPSAAELGDAIYWQAQGDSSKMDTYLAKCASVKAQFPKPSVE